MLRRKINTRQTAARNKKSRRSTDKKGLSVSPLFFVMFAVMAVMGEGYVCVTYAATVILHEMAHAEVAKKLGYALCGIRLNVYGASLTGEFESVRPSDEAIIALAGPAFNLFAAICGVAFWWIVPESYFILQAFVEANLFTAIFNILPVFPLDGGRILLALLSKKLPRRRVYRRLRIFGYAAAVAFAALFGISFYRKANFSFAVIAAFVFMSAAIPDKSSYYERLYGMAFKSERLKRGLAVRELLIGEECRLLTAIKMLNANYYTKFSVVDGGLNAVFGFTETELDAMSLKYPPTSRICDLPEFPKKNL